MLGLDALSHDDHHGLALADIDGVHHVGEEGAVAGKRCPADRDGVATGCDAHLLTAGHGVWSEITRNDIDNTSQLRLTALLTI